jgi:predicted nucleotidyltransferase
MYLSEYIHQKPKQFTDLCRTHKVKKLYAFGSSINKNFDLAKSDIDLMVEVASDNPLEKGEILLNFYEASGIFFGRKIDLLTDQPIENPYLKKQVDDTKILIYDGEGEKILI